MKVIKKIIVFFVFLGVFAFGFKFFIAKNYEQQLKAVAIAKINKQLATEIDVSDIELTVFKKFPYTSLEFKDVLAKDALITIGAKDSLFYFEYAYLQFNIFDILNNRFILREIDLENGFLNASVNKEGYDNYHIFKQVEGESNDFLVRLKKVQLNNIVLNYKNEPRKDKISFKAKNAHLKGDFSNKEFQLDVSGDFHLNTITTSNKTWVKNREITLNTNLEINQNTKIYHFSKGDILIDKELKFKVSGSVENLKEVKLNLNIDGDNLNIVKTIALLPKQHQSKLEKYRSKGNISFNSTIKGIPNSKKPLAITAKFQIEKGAIVAEKNNLELHNLNLKGVFDSKGVFELNEVSGTLKDTHFEGGFKMKGFTHPFVEANLKATFDLAELKDFLQLDTLQYITGTATIDAIFKGKINDLSNITTKDFQRSKTTGQLELSNVAFQLKKSHLAYDSLNAMLDLRANSMLIKELSGKVLNSDFHLTGIFRNFMSYVFLAHQKLSVEAVFKSKKLDLNELLGADEKASETQDISYTLNLPKNIQFNVKATIDELHFRAFKSKNITGIVKYTTNKLSAHPLSFQTMEGGFKGSLLFYHLANNNFRLITDFKIKDVNIKELFTQMENFDQDVLTARHLEGKTNASIKFRTDLTPELKLIQKSIYSNVDLTINNGKLIDFEPLYSISDYVKSNKIIAVFIRPKRLEESFKTIEFTTLRNQISIKNEVITIPKMEINSSVLNITGAGSHSFDNKIDYQVNFFLSELLTKKENKKGRTPIYLTVKGTVDNPVINLDKKASTSKISTTVKEEKKEVKQALKEEFGMFKKDTSLQEITTPKEEKIDFKIEWEEEEDSPKNSEEKTEQKKSTKNKFLNILKEDEKNNEDDFDFEEDDF